MENMISIADRFLSIDEEEKDIWKVKDDLEANWCLDKIRESKAEYNRLEAVSKAKIQQIQELLKKEKEKADREIGFFESKLREYFETVETQDTKTLKKYKLPSGELKLKKPQATFKYNKKKLVKVADKYENMQDYVKIKKDFDWAGFKNNLIISDGNIINKNTGEIVEIDGLSIEEKPEDFKVKVE
ncbi:MAG: host-nuclease inhibitor Gam family protein [Thermotaleaceae bacterium]